MSEEMRHKARPFFKMIESAFEELAKRFCLHFHPWYHDQPYFLLQHPRPDQKDFEGLKKEIIVSIVPKEDGAIVCVFARVFLEKKNGGRSKSNIAKIKSFYIFFGELPREKDRVAEMLELSWNILCATRESDLFDEPEEGLVPIPIFGNTDIVISGVTRRRR